MKANQDQSSRFVLPTDSITEAIIGFAMQAHNELGNGFLEKVYENALALDLIQTGHNVQQQTELEVSCHGHCIGKYIPDLLVDKQVIVEIKAVRALDDIHIAQCKHYLKATG